MRLATSTNPGSLIPGRGRRRRDHFWNPEIFSCTPSPSLKKKLSKISCRWDLDPCALKGLKTVRKVAFLKETSSQKKVLRSTLPLAPSDGMPQRVRHATPLERPRFEPRKEQASTHHENGKNTSKLMPGTPFRKPKIL